MKIMISGNKGQLGTTLHKILKQKESILGKIPQSMQKASVCGVDLPELDITDKVAVEKFISKEKPDIIINCAAYTNVDNCEKEKDLAFRINTLGPMYLAQACNKNGISLVHVSTDYVFEGNADNHYCEFDKTNPQGVYGKTKLMGEEYVKQYCAKSFIIRTSWLYAHEGANFVKTIINLAKTNKELKIVNDQKGNPTNAEDLAHHILKLADTSNWGLYHCTNNGVCSWYEFACEFLNIAGVKCSVAPCTTEEFPRLASRPSFSALDNMMLRNTIGDEMRSWKDAITCYMSNMTK